MPKPVTPLVGSDVFVLNGEDKLLLIKRTDNGLWALPGGCQDLGETSVECAEREAWEESGYRVKVTGLLGVFSSKRYPYVHYPWKENEFCHLFFRAELVGGEPTLSEESQAVGWFSEAELPPLSDGHGVRIQLGFKARRDPSLPAFFE